MRDGRAFCSAPHGLGEQLLAGRRIRAANRRLDRRLDRGPDRGPERPAEPVPLVTDGTVRPVIGATLSLEDAPRALAGGVGTTGPDRGA